MKRLGTTLAAAALTGAIAFAGVPASASEGAVPQETTTLGDRGTNDENNDGDREKEDDGDRNRNEGETPYGGGSTSRVECADDEDATLNIKWGEERPESFEYDGNTWFQHEDGEHYVTDSANRDGELSEQDEFKSDQAAAKKFGYSCDYESSDEGEENHGGGSENPGGDNGREDCESTENNGGNSGDGNNGENCETTTLGDRGMNAETGDNTVARVLFALAALSVLGAAAFGARRFFTA